MQRASRSKPLHLLPSWPRKSLQPWYYLPFGILHVQLFSATARSFLELLEALEVCQRNWCSGRRDAPTWSTRPAFRARSRNPDAASQPRSLLHISLCLQQFGHLLGVKGLCFRFCILAAGSCRSLAKEINKLPKLPRLAHAGPSKDNQAL